MLVVVLVSTIFVAGCGMVMNGEYSDRLAAAVLWSASESQKADNGDLTTAEMVQALKDNAAKWRDFKQARGPWLGVSEVWMNASYSLMLDRSVGWTSDMARRASAGSLDENSLKHILQTNARLWKLFGEARKGIAPEEEDE